MIMDDQKERDRLMQDDNVPSLWCDTILDLLIMNSWNSKLVNVAPLSDTNVSGSPNVAKVYCNFKLSLHQLML